MGTEVATKGLVWLAVDRRDNVVLGCQGTSHGRYRHEPVASSTDASATTGRSNPNLWVHNLAAWALALSAETMTVRQQSFLWILVLAV